MNPNIYNQPNNVYSNANSFNQFTTNPLIPITNTTGDIYDAS